MNCYYSIVLYTFGSYIPYKDICLINRNET